MPDRKEYIEREALIDRFDYYRDCFATEHDYDLAVATVEGTAIEDNVVEVVRCEKCVHFRITETPTGTIMGCMRLGFSPCNPDDYCSYGERKENSE